MNPRTGGPLGLCAVLSLAACNPRESGPTSAPAGSSAGAVGASAKPAPPPALSAAPTPTTPRESADSWLVVGKDGVELGVIELRAGQPPSLTIEADNPDAAALKTKLAEIGGPNGIPLDMHLPSPSGTGRGPYGTRIIKYGDSLYRHAVKEELEPTFSAKEDSKETLVTARAKPGDANYAEVVVLLLMVERYYLARYAYALEFSQ